MRGSRVRRAFLFACLLGTGGCGGRAATPTDAATTDAPASDIGPSIDDGLPAADASDAAADTGPGPGPDPATWAPRELIAARLSRFLWNQPVPDAAIVVAVQAAESADDVAALADYMLRDARARTGVAAFFSWWLRLGDLPTLPRDDPDGIFTAETRAALQQEAPAFGTHVVFDGDGRYETLMTAPYTFMNETIARHYGVAGVTGPELRLVPFGTPDRIGLLGEASVLARFAANTLALWPPRRFWLVRQTLYCRTGLDSSVPINTSGFVMDPAQPLRPQLEAYTAPDMCRVCHRIVNPLGYAFIRFNSLGQLWTDGPAGPYDVASSTAVIPPGYLPADFTDVTFMGQPDFMRQVAPRPETQSCFAWIALNFAVDRPANPEVIGFAHDLDPDLPALAASFYAAGGNIHALLPAITRTPGFLQATTAVPPN